MKTRFRHKRVPRVKFRSLWEATAYGSSFDWADKPYTPYFLDLFAQPYTRDNKPFDPHERGGITTCEIVDDGEVVAQGVAYCSPKDAFCYRVGRAIAGGRAAKQLQKVLKEANDGRTG